MHFGAFISFKVTGPSPVSFEYAQTADPKVAAGSKASQSDSYSLQTKLTTPALMRNVIIKAYSGFSAFKKLNWMS